MIQPKSDFQVGAHRPVYLWAGPGTVRMNRLKFMDAPVDEPVHLEAHFPPAANRLAQQAGFNWAYLTYDWGFPPEVEQEDWETFGQAVAVYHTAGIKIIGYVQTSNCVFAGSYQNKGWYAQDPRGRPFYYYTGRYMTCWRHPEWLEHLREMVRGVIAAGADGVFFDNPWHASQTLHFAGAWLGPAGCYCPDCRNAYRSASGQEIPIHIQPEKEASQQYLRWRAELVTGTLEGLARDARELNPGIVISANNFDAVMRPSYLVFGIDLVGLSKVQDVLMIEDYGLPRWEKAGRGTELLVNNALTLRTARALAGDTPLSTNPYDRGIGFDDVYPPRRIQQGIAEAAACGATMVVKGTEFVHRGRFTLLTAAEFESQREAVGAYHRWLVENAGLYQNRRNQARVGLLHPGDRLWQDWDRLAPLYFGAGQVLLAAGVPWQVVQPHQDHAGLDLLLVSEPDMDKLSSSARRVVSIPSLPGWELKKMPLLARHRSFSRPLESLVGELYRAYFECRWARRLGDRLGLAHLFLQLPYFHLPPGPARQAMLSALEPLPYPHLKAGAPVLVEHWKDSHQHQIHLVNYGPTPQEVGLDFGASVEGVILSPDSPERVFLGQQSSLLLDVYSVLCYRFANSGEFV